MKPLDIRGYYITEDARVFSDRSGTLYELSQNCDKDGYKIVKLAKKTYVVHRLGRLAE